MIQTRKEKEKILFKMIKIHIYTVKIKQKKTLLIRRINVKNFMMVTIICISKMAGFFRITTDVQKTSKSVPSFRYTHK